MAADATSVLMMPDYSASPFWRRDGANVVPAALRLGNETRHRLREWVRWFETSSYWEHSTEEALRYFATDDEQDAFDEEGVRLWMTVRRETAGRFLVGYHSLMRGERVWDPSQLPRAVFGKVLAEFDAEPAPAGPTAARPQTAAPPPTSPSEHERKMASNPVYRQAYEAALARERGKTKL